MGVSVQTQKTSKVRNGTQGVDGPKKVHTLDLLLKRSSEESTGTCLSEQSAALRGGFIGPRPQLPGLLRLQAELLPEV